MQRRQFFTLVGGGIALPVAALRDGLEKLGLLARTDEVIE
jgi:hypothetical protein